MKPSRNSLSAVIFSCCLFWTISLFAVSAYADGPRDTVFEYLTDTAELSPAAACGIMANIDKESAFNADITGAGGAYGFCQWMGIRRTNLMNYCASIGYGSNTAEGQVRFLHHELQTIFPDVLMYLRSVDNSAAGAYNAAYHFCYYYERPNNAYSLSVNRGNHAQNVIWPLYGMNACFLRVKDTAEGMVLSWGGTKDVQYVVYRATDRAGKFKKIAVNNAGEDNTYTDTKAKTGSKYDYLVVKVQNAEDVVNSFMGESGCKAAHSNCVEKTRQYWITDEECKYSFDKEAYTYTGVEIKPVITLSYYGKTMQEGTDYSVSYVNNVDAGKAAAVITGKGNYPGERILGFRIEKAKQVISVPVRKVVFSSRAQLFKIEAQGETEVISSDKSVAYYKNGYLITKKCGRIKLTVKATATDNYKAAEKTVTITVIPDQPILKKVTAKKVSATKDNVILRFKSTCSPSGYVLQYTVKGKFDKKTRVWIKDPSAVKYVLKSQKREKGRLYRLCAYVKIGKKYYYGKWGKPRGVG